jgi:rhodanese-related sulfurtransferase
MGKKGGEKAPEISTAELRAILDAGSAVVFDARSPREFGTGHIPRARNVPGKPGLAPSQYTSDVREVERALKGDHSANVVIYCNGMFCGRTKRLADELVAAGYTHVRRYQLGMPVWRALGGVQQIELDGLRSVLETDRTAVLFDARGGSALPGARGLVLADVEAAKDDGRLPMEDHHTRILVVGANGVQARAVAEAIAREAFDNVAFFEGDPSALSEQAAPASSAELARRLKGIPVTLQDGLTASAAKGKPISGKFEVEHGQLQLSVYTATADGYAEVIVDHRTGEVVKTTAITAGEDFAAAQAQSEALGKARTSLRAAVRKAARANNGYRPVRASYAIRDGHPVARVTLMKGGESKAISITLD